MHQISADRATSRRNNVGPYDVFVCNLAGGVHIHPTGKGAQLLTRVVQHALAHGHNNVKLSGVRAYATRYGIAVPAVDAMGPNAAAEDMAALARHKVTAQQYFKANFS